ncbi:hypothetical protein [Streptomyces griseus]|uniref:hypothetical protein n=1 Tax=Streptomyces griseus TaxID=1911 RepID=UPI000565F00D|nr:hypothetical protein [Streptomyces griseus]
MIRAARTLLPTLILPALLAGCGTEKADTGTGGERTNGSTEPTDARTADPAELASRAQALGIAPEFVYVTEAAGYTLAQQSVGVYGDDGFSATYWSRKSGTQLQLSVDRGTLTADNCSKEPIADASSRTTCVRDGDAWYRSNGQQKEYAIPKEGHVVRLRGEGVPREVLSEAARAVHRPTVDELDTLLPEAPARPTEPVERGDLPPVGDGAPNNDVGVGG